MLLARLLGARSARLSFEGGDLYAKITDGRTVKVNFDGSDFSAKINFGMLFSSLRLDGLDATCAIRWISKKLARQTFQWLVDVKHKKLAPDVARAALKITQILKEGYLRDSRLAYIKRIAEGQRDRFQNPPTSESVGERHMKNLNLLRSIALLSESGTEQIRENYVARRLDLFSEYFDNIENNPLTFAQRRACVVDQDNNLVLAGAGTGKTSVMVGRAGYLVSGWQAKPDEILMLAFARKAAQEMQERINSRIEGENIAVMTFHKLGKEIIADVEGGQPSVTSLAEDDKQLRHHVNRWFEQYMRGAKYRDKVLAYFRDYLYPDKNSFEFENLGEYYDFIKNNDIRTLKGEKVKGVGECLVANYLFSMGINYVYEGHYEHEARSQDYRQYQPDFYLPDYEVYIEHLGIDRDGSTAPYVDKEEYHSKIEWTRRLHQKHGTLLVETYHHEHVEGTLHRNLEQKLEEEGVVFNPLPPGKILQKLRDFGAISAFAGLLADLLRRYKACHFKEGQLEEKVRKASHPQKARAALELLWPVLTSYEAKLKKEGEIDFDDMIGRAISYVKEGRYQPKWRFILVDEFQDISSPRAALLQALKNSVPDSSLFCVGDDWQSIYRFTGSDIAFTTSFHDKFGATKITALDKTFRSNSSICDIASEFVLKNPSQMRKKLTAHTVVSYPTVSIMRRSRDKTSEQIENIDSRINHVLARISMLAEKGSTVYVLGRYGWMLPSSKLLTERGEYLGLNISAHTMHASKGKEADYVILTGVQSGKHGFPSQKVTDPLLDMLLPDVESFDCAEERRLFYVALTRARRRAYIICDMVTASEFVVELIRDKYPVELNEFETTDAQKLFQLMKCQECVTGTMVPRNGKYGFFFGCTHYPLCKNTEQGCNLCDGPMKRVEGKKICMDEDCRDWIHVCSICGADMKLISGRYGKFWGCKNFRGNEPVSCRGTIDA